MEIQILKFQKKNERRPLKFKYDNPKEEETSVVPWYPSSVIPTTAVFSKKETVTQQKRFQVFNNILWSHSLVPALCVPTNASGA